MGNTVYKKSRERAVQFEKELKALLNKWGAEIGLEDIGRTYYPDYIINVYIPHKWNEDGECIAESVEINLGTYVDAN